MKIMKICCYCEYVRNCGGYEKPTVWKDFRHSITQLSLKALDATRTLERWWKQINKIFVNRMRLKCCFWADLRVFPIDLFYETASEFHWSDSSLNWDMNVKIGERVHIKGENVFSKIIHCTIFILVVWRNIRRLRIRLVRDGPLQWLSTVTPRSPENEVCQPKMLLFFPFESMKQITFNLK